MTTAPRTPPTIDDTLASLNRAGWRDPIICRDDHRMGPYPNFLRALWIAWRRLEQYYFCSDVYPLESVQPAYCLVVQDDIDISVGLKAHLTDRPPRQDGITSLYTSAAFGKLPDGLHDASHNHGRWPTSCGALALVFPWWIATRFLHNAPMPHKQLAADYWISRWCRDNKIPYWIHAPSFVKHTGAVSSLDNPNTNHHWRQCRSWLPEVGGEPERMHYHQGHRKT